MILAAIVFGSLLLLVASVFTYLEPPSFSQTPKQVWIKEAKNYFLNHVDLEDWDDVQIDAYLEDLYTWFSVQGYTGKQAVKEDMSYWEE